MNYKEKPVSQLTEEQQAAHDARRREELHAEQSTPHARIQAFAEARQKELAETYGRDPSLSHKARIEGIARAFHDFYEELAPEHGYETRQESRKPWGEVPQNNKDLMCAVVARLLEEGIIS